MELGMQVGLGLGNIVLNGDQVLVPKRAQPPIFDPYLLQPNGCIDQYVTWVQPSPPPKKKLSAHVYCGQTGGWMKLVLGMMVGLSPGDFVLHGNSVPLPKRGQGLPFPNFRPISIVAKWLDASRCHLVRM